jgi:mono/diheme cytochrome c family protein
MKLGDRGFLSPAAFLMALAFAPGAFAAEPAKENFGNLCAACHGADGKARTPAGRKLGAKDLSESKLSGAEIEKLISEGAKDTRGAVKMPSFKEKLTSAEITALAAYVNTFRAR